VARASLLSLNTQIDIHGSTQLHVTKPSDVELSPDQRAIFSGAVETYALPDERRQYTARVALVAFSPNSRTTWHRHSSDQVLLIVQGRGVVATDEGQSRVEAGDLVLIPAGERHWHGGTVDEGMRHISVLGPGETEVLEPVSGQSSSR
jgi:quercetin dioxygenase-like cupin family protein